MSDMEIVDLAIIGAGWHGLAVAKVYTELHPTEDVVVLDSAKSVGGVWASERLYPGLKSNNLKGTYEYPDFPLEEKDFGIRAGQFLPGTTVHDYLNTFARKFDIERRIRFQTKVETAEKRGDSWLLQLSDQDANQKSLLARKLVLATGQTSSPFLPALPGVDRFESPLFHVKSMAQRTEVLKGAKEVVVLGASKSAYDAAYACAVAGGNAKVHMIVRESGHGPTWVVPPYVTPLKKWLEKLTMTRLLTFFSPCVWGFHDGYAKIRNFFHGTKFGRKIVDAFWGIIEDDCATLNAYTKHPETAKLRPWTSMMFIGTSIGILNYDQDFFQLVRDGKIQVHVADITSLDKNSVYLSSGERLKADALICSTGWEHHPPLQFLPAGLDKEVGLPHYSPTTSSLVEKADKEILATFPRLKDQPIVNPKLVEYRSKASDDFSPNKLNVPYQLYRFMVPPAYIHDRSIGFAGVPSQIITATGASIQALWLTAYLDGSLEIEGTDDQIMYESVLHSRFGKWRYPSGRGHQFPDFVFDTVPYFDMLLQQLGLPSHRKNGRLSEIFSSYGPEDYRGLVEEWKAVHGHANEKAA